MNAWRLSAGASSLDDRDQAIVTGNYFGAKTPVDITPLPDGAGVVEAVGKVVINAG